MFHVKTLVLCALVAGFAAPLLGSDLDDLYLSYKKSGADVPTWLTAAIFGVHNDIGIRSGGDDPGAATVIAFTPGGTYVDAGSTLGLTDNYDSDEAPLNCNFSYYLNSFASPDAFYTFTLDGSYEVEVSVCDAANYDTVLGIVDATGALVAISDDGSGCADYSSWIEPCCLLEGTYFIVVDGFGGAAGDYEMTVNFGDETCADLPPCEEWSELAITLPYHGTGNSEQAIDIFGSPAGDVGYKFTLAEASLVELQTCYDGTLFDTDSYWFFDGGPCDGEYLGYNDGEYDCGYATHVVYDCEAPLSAGTYVVLISGWELEEGDFEVDILAEPCEVVDADELPRAFDLKQNHPNPFNPTTTIDFVISETGAASLKVYDMSGREVATLVNGLRAVGEHSVVFDASALASGVYFYILETATFSQTQKMLLVK
jgi:hypothetical protein